MKEVFLDTETTGLSLKEKHRIVEIACIETENLIPTNRIFHKLINPERSVPDDAVKIHGFTEIFLKNKNKFNNIADEFLEFILDKKIIIHNAPFDLGFINFELKRLKKDLIKSENVVDTLELARGKYPGSSNSLDALCKRFNIDLSRRTKHNALLDCELLREVYINLLEVKEPRLFTNEKEELIEQNASVNKSNYCKKIIKPSPDEIEKHSGFLKSELKKNFY